MYLLNKTFNWKWVTYIVLTICSILVAIYIDPTHAAFILILTFTLQAIVYILARTTFRLLVQRHKTQYCTRKICFYGASEYALNIKSKAKKFIKWTNKSSNAFSIGYMSYILTDFAFLATI